MLHLSWWVDKQSDRLRTLLGSTPGHEILDPGKSVNWKSANSKSDNSKSVKSGCVNPDCVNFKSKSDNSKIDNSKSDNSKMVCPDCVNTEGSPRGNLIIRDRQKLLEDAGFPRQQREKPRPGEYVIHPRVEDNIHGEEGSTGVGRCAETYFYIVSCFKYYPRFLCKKKLTLLRSGPEPM